MASVSVSDVIWGELDRCFKTALEYLIKDIAEALGQPQDPLKKALNGKMNLHLIEDGAASFTQRCTYLCSHADTPAFLSECGEPILWFLPEQPTKRCPRHLALAPAKLPSLVLTPLEGGYAYASDGTVYNGQGEACGFYESGVLTVFETV